MFLLTADFPGRDSLIEQARTVKATGDCDCGYGTINLSVDSDGPLAAVRGSVPVEALNKRGGAIDVLLFVRDGRLSRLEIVKDDGDHPAPYPKPEDLEISVSP